MHLKEWKTVLPSAFILGGLGKILFLFQFEYSKPLTIHYDRIRRVQKRASQLVICGIKEINMWPKKDPTKIWPR